MSKALILQQNNNKDKNRSNVEQNCVLLPDEIKDYFSALRRKIQISLMIAFMLPLLLLSSYFHFQFNLTLKNSGKLHLKAIAESQRNTIDLFLKERIVNIFNLFHHNEFKLKPSQEEIHSYLKYLQEMSDSFYDAGFLESSGIQIAYAGPFDFLTGKDYSSEAWFKTLMKSNNNYYISDIYLGFRQKPHFTIAVKQLFNGRLYVMRATLDPGKFNNYLQTIRQDNSNITALINKKGDYQLVDSRIGQSQSPSGYIPPTTDGSGSNETLLNGETELVAYAWLKVAPWALIVRQPLKVAYANMYYTRVILITISLAIVGLLFVVIHLTTNRLIRKLRDMEVNRRELHGQLIHATKLASVGELAGGVAHEINNPLAIIAAESGVIRDMLNPEFHLVWTPKSIYEELNYIDEAVYRARDITQKLLIYVRKDKPKLTPNNVNRIIEEVIDGFMEKQLTVSGIKLVRKLMPDLPKVFMDRDQFRQVILNLINNAKDAIIETEKKTGTISIATHANNKYVLLKIKDTGIGIPPEQREKIFLPFYTTKEVGKGTGLGLSVSLSIINAMGGQIRLYSKPGEGSCFILLLPFIKKCT